MSSFGYGRLTRRRETYSPRSFKRLQDDVRLLTRAAQEDHTPARSDLRDAAGRVKEELDGASENGPTGVSAYVDAMAAIIPGEALVFYATAVAATKAVQSETVDDTISLTILSQSGTSWILALSVVLSLVLFVIGKLGSEYEDWDWLRMALPPIATAVWLTIQEPSLLLTLVEPHVDETVVHVIALGTAVLVTAVAAALAKKAEETEPKTKSARDAAGDGGQV